MGALRIKIEHWAQTKFGVRWLPEEMKKRPEQQQEKAETEEAEGVPEEEEGVVEHSEDPGVTETKVCAAEDQQNAEKAKEAERAAEQASETDAAAEKQAESPAKPSKSGEPTDVPRCSVCGAPEDEDENGDAPAVPPPRFEPKPETTDDLWPEAAEMMVEGDSLEVLVEVFRISEDDVAKREKIDFVHDSMTTFARSWHQLMRFHVWVFSKYGGLNSGSSTTELERIDGATSEDARFIGAFRAGCTINFQLDKCPVESWPAEVDFECRIQKDSDLPDFERLGKMHIDDEIRFLDAYVHDSHFEPTLPPPHVTTLRRVVARPFSVSAKNVASQDPVAARVAISITNHHPTRKLCVCDVHFLIEPKPNKKLLKAFKWYWVAREPTPYDLLPGQRWTFRLDIYAMKEGHENAVIESQLEVAFDWYNHANAKHLAIYPSTHTITWRAAATSVEEERKPVIDLSKATANPYEGVLPVQLPDPPAEGEESLRVMRAFVGTRDPINGCRVFPPPDEEDEGEVDRGNSSS